MIVTTIHKFSPTTRIAANTILSMACAATYAAAYRWRRASACPPRRWIASSGEDQTVRLWHADGKPGPVLKGHTAAVPSVAWSPDGSWLASGSGESDTTVRLWSADGRPGPVVAPKVGVAYSVAWRGDGKQLAVSGYYTMVRLVDVDGTLGPAFHTGPARVTGAVTWRPDGRELAVSDLDKLIRFWDPNSRQVTRTIVLFENGKSATFSAAGELLDGDPAVLDKELVCIIERPTGERELVPSSA